MSPLLKLSWLNQEMMPFNKPALGAIVKIKFIMLDKPQNAWPVVLVPEPPLLLHVTVWMAWITKKKKLLCITASLEILLLHNAWHAMGSKARIVLALCPKWRFLSKAHIKRKHILSLIYCVTVLSLFSPTLNPALKPFILHNWVVGDIEKSEWLYWPCDL